MRIRVFRTIAVAVLAAACGDVYADVDPELGPMGESQDVDGGVMPVDFPGAAPFTPCPATRPRENTMCELGLACEYGKSADPECNTISVCRGSPGQGAWETRPVGSCHAAMCPAVADVASLAGTPCTIAQDGEATTDADEAICNMTDGVCACTTGPDLSAAHARKWVCTRPLSECPPQRPLVGQPCAGSLWCDYGSCTFKNGVLMECIDGAWQAGAKTCR
jgi:hypothetical protein